MVVSWLRRSFVAVVSRLCHGRVTVASRLCHGCVAVPSRICRDRQLLIEILRRETAFVYGAALMFVRVSKPFSFSLSDSRKPLFARKTTKNQRDTRTRRVRSVWWL